MRSIPLMTTALVLAACGKPIETMKTPVIPTGEGQLAVPGGSIWYKVTGSGPGTPVVLLHGGPGFSSFYLKPLEALGDDRPVIRYDQLGGGKSGTATDTTMFTIPHFVAELDSLRARFGIPSWHVVGHSWGTILALEYYRAHPDHVASLTLGSPVFDVPAYAEHARTLLATMPDSIQRVVREAEASGRFDSPAYGVAINAFYALYVFRHPVAADLDSSFATFNQAIYNYMQGPSEFTITGTLKDYDVRAFLPSIRVPTLFTVGEFDEVGPDLVRGFADSIPGAGYVVLDGSAHITTWDAPEQAVRAVREFLRAADSASGPPN